jgi:predicted nuclease of predicted toxin-antitoxin system
MAEGIRFHFDESVELAVAKGLRRLGLDITTSQEMALLHKDDDVQFAFAKAQGRVIVTHDTHFFGLVAQQAEHPGLVFCEMHSRSIGEMVRGLKHIYDNHTPQEMSGQIEYL